MHIAARYKGEDEAARSWWLHTRVMLMRQFGWTVEYCDGLPMETVNEILAVMEAEARAK